MAFLRDLCKDLPLGTQGHIFLPYLEINIFPLFVFLSPPAPGLMVHKTAGVFSWACFWKGDDFYICADPPALEQWAMS